MRSKIFLALSLISFMVTPLWGVIESEGAQKMEPSDTIVWDISTVMEFSGKSSCALDSQGTIHIGFIDLMEGDVKYAKLTDDGWDIETVDSGNHVTQYTSIAIDSNDRPHMAYCYNSSEMNMEDKQLVYAKRSEDGWSTEILATGLLTGSPFSLTLDSEDRPYICAYNFTEYLNEYGWFDYIPLSVKCVYFNGSQWNIETVDSQGYIGSGCSITMDSNDRPHMTYIDHSYGDLKYAFFNGSQWVKDIVDTDDSVRWYTSIVTDSMDLPHIAYYNDTLKYASLSNGQWSISTLDPQDYVGVFGSLYLDRRDQPHISYYDADNGDLKYTYNKNGSWMTITVDEDQSVGLFSSLVVDLENDPHIFYDYGRPHSALKHACPLRELSYPAPPKVIETEASDEIIDIFWEPTEYDGGSPVTRYDVYRGEKPGEEMLIDSVTTTYYHDSSVIKGSEYHYYIKAVNEVGESQQSDGLFALAEGEVKHIDTDGDGNSVGELVTFDVSAFAVGSGTYLLDFGDGSNTSWKRVHTFTHVYTSPGKYDVVLMKKDDVRYPQERWVDTIDVEIIEDDEKTYAGMTKEAIFLLFSLIVSVMIISYLIRILKSRVGSDELETDMDGELPERGKREKGPPR